MQTMINTGQPQKPNPIQRTILTIGQILLILIGIQSLRIILFLILAWIGSKTGLYSPLGKFIDILTFGLLGMALCLFFRPKKEALGFDLSTLGKKTRLAEVAGAIILIILAAINISQDMNQLVPTLVSCLVFPFFEEPLFRGWIWNKLSSNLPQRWAGPVCTFLVTILFAVWHLGYVDEVALHMGNNMLSPAILHVMLMKMVIASIIGFAAGLLRWRTGNIYGSILMHAFWNLFGR